MTVAPLPLLPRIHTIRGEAVVLDSDLALLYGVETDQFNRAIKRNGALFPDDFAFRLTPAAWKALRCQIGTLKAGCGQHWKYLPMAFTGHGALMGGSLFSIATLHWHVSPQRSVNPK